MFVFLLLSFFINAAILPPAYILSKYSKEKNSDTLKIKMQVNYSDITINETLLYSSPNNYRTVVESGTDAILFIRKAKDCIAISKSKQIVLSCPEFVNNFFYNIIFYNPNYFSYLKTLGINFDENNLDVTIDKESGKSVEPKFTHLFLLGEKPIYNIGLSIDEINKTLISVKNNYKENISENLLKELMYQSPQVWVDQNSLLPIRIFGKTGDKTLEIALKYFTKDSNNFTYPKGIEYSVDKKIRATYNITELESKLRIKEDLFDIAHYKKRFDQVVDTETFSETKAVLLNYIREYR